MRRRTSRQRQRGQAMIEFALVLPLLVMMLGAAAYFGFAVTAQQRLAMAARHAARLIAIESTNGATSPMQGSAKGQSDNTYVAGLGEGRFRELAMQMLPDFENRLVVRPPKWPSKVKALGEGYVGLYTNKSAQTGFVAGVLFYGCTLAYELRELNWLATLMGVGIWGDGRGLEIATTCVMPGELPLRGQAGRHKFGLLDLNPAFVKEAAESVNEGMYKNLPPLIEP